MKWLSAGNVARFQFQDGKIRDWIIIGLPFNLSGFCPQDFSYTMGGKQIHINVWDHQTGYKSQIITVWENLKAYLQDNPDAFERESPLTEILREELKQKCG